MKVADLEMIQKILAHMVLVCYRQQLNKLFIDARFPCQQRAR